MQAVIEAAHVLRRPIAELTAQDVEMWAGGRMIKQLQATSADDSDNVPCA